MKKHLRVNKALIGQKWVHNLVMTIENGRVTGLTDVNTGDDSAKPQHSYTSLTVDMHIQGTVIPGYIDTQVNGGGGIMFNQTPSFHRLRVMADAHRQFGTTTLFPTLITDQIDVIERAADAIAEAISDEHPSIAGVHFEGPHLSVEKKGVHPPRFIRKLSDRELDTYTRTDLGQVVLTVAPENVPTSVIGELVASGVVVALGHSNATYRQVERAIEAGATGFTHLFNAMSPLTSREPGMVGAALLNKCLCGLIVDHQHVHPKTVELAYKIKGPHELMLVTDAMAHVGTTQQTIPFFDRNISRQGNKLTTEDGTLAGSCLDMHSALMHCVNDIQIPLADASAMASTTPAAFTKIRDRVGDIAIGKVANFLVLDDNNALNAVWQYGQQVSGITIPNNN
ncbi:N-acetylglucosamine-6-phosphate deacetylase [Alteromonas sp. D210916BOD_24]|uniref:N-acetylglucosamine-6-phosphate deacetylase n=1 Tax=Alteromonas sp. D210916BOD_24 TaxID=3157618 RepID=UPI00399CEB5D